MSLRIFLFSVIAVSALVGCASAPPVALETPTTDAVESRSNYKIAPGDVLDITVFGQDDLSGEYTVDANGNISLPLIDEVTASGMSTGDLSLRLIDALRPDYLRNPDVSVKLGSYRPIYVLGEVQKAGSYPYQPNMSVLSAIAVAGGYTYRAAKKKLFVVRSDDKNRTETPILESSTLRPGDTVIIRQRLF